MKNKNEIRLFDDGTFSINLVDRNKINVLIKEFAQKEVGYIVCVRERSFTGQTLPGQEGGTRIEASVPDLESIKDAKKEDAQWFLTFGNYNSDNHREARFFFIPNEELPSWVILQARDTDIKQHVARVVSNEKYPFDKVSWELAPKTKIK